MKKVLAITALASLATAGAQSVELGLTAGYANGLSGELFVHAPNVAGPVGVKVGVSMTRPVDSINDKAPYDPSGAIFPSTYTFGNAKQPTSQGGQGVTESGSHTVFSVDGTYGLGEFAPGAEAMVYAGGRYGMFKSSESVSGATSTFSSNAFGLGFGSMASYALSGNLSLVGDLGVDYFFNGGAIKRNSTLANGQTSNDTYSPGDADFATYNNRVVRPGVVFKARIGVKTSF